MHTLTQRLPSCATHLNFFPLHDCSVCSFFDALHQTRE